MNYTGCKSIDGEMFEKFVMCGAGYLGRNVERINELNVFPIPDGDTGDNMFRTISGGVKEMSKEQSSSVAKKAKALAAGMLLSARGNSGVILSQIFSGISAGLEGIEEATLADVAAALESGVRRAYETVVSPVEGTILTVVRESAEAAGDVIDDKTTLGELARLLLERMRVSLEHTPELLDVLKEAGVVDSGGAGLYMIAKGIADAIEGSADEGVHVSEGAAAQEIDFDLFPSDASFEFGYCTELLLRLMSSKTDPDLFDTEALIKYLETLGDSIVAFRDGSIVKLHVHTFTPAKVLEYCQRYGEFLQVKIENMMLQHNSAPEVKNDLIPTVERSRKKYASVVVSNGAGMSEVFRELGADVVIDGGQGKNPSTKDFLDAIDEACAENVFIFPNNSNIILAASQAADMCRGARAVVIPSKNPGHAYAALSMLDYSFETPEEVRENFIVNMEYVGCGMVSRAVREVEMSGVAVKTGDYIGFTEKTIVSSDPDKTAALEGLCRGMITEERSIVTLIYGADASEEDRVAARELFGAKWGAMEFYEIDGGQEIYDYIIILE